MTKALLIAFPCVGIYIGIALAVYAVLNKIDPYDEATDWLGDGDGNKGIALAWPVTVPAILVLGAFGGMFCLMDLIRKYQKGGDGDDRR